MGEIKGLGLPQTKGSFQLSGIVTGMLKDSHYKETTTKTGKPWRILNFGVQTDKDSTIYVTLSGGEKEEVYFSKSITTDDGKKKIETKKVLWKDRFKFKEDGYRLIGVNVGVTKKKDEKGNDVNDKKLLTEYDACREISDNLIDGKSVFVRGNIEYSHFDNNGNSKHMIKFIPTQVSLCKDIDFDKEDFVPTADFTQYIIFMGIKPENEKNERFVVDAKIVNYNSIEDTEFIIEKKDLAVLFKKKFKAIHRNQSLGKY